MSNTEQNWKKYLETKLPKVTSVLNKHGFSLEDNQPHVMGERFLMKALTTAGGQKLILLGKRQDTGDRVVIKITDDNAGKSELAHEKLCRQMLHRLNFAYNIFHSPEELAFLSEDNFILSVHSFIEQDSSFLERPLPEQFDFALEAFKAQESARATTHSHFKQITNTFGNRTSQDYLRLFDAFVSALKNKKAPQRTVELVGKTSEKLHQNSRRIEQYCGFLTHTDFVPHNFRIAGDVLYLLDFSSLRFGNKHESWARFLNFMTLYNRDLEALLIKYVEDNRAPEERESLQLMRLFRLGEIITYYINLLPDSEGKLLELNKKRVEFWTEVLAAELENKRVDTDMVDTYKKTRDELRSADEKERQKGLH